LGVEIEISIEITSRQIETPRLRIFPKFNVVEFDAATTPFSINM
jgi:hypothetical protein